jgi:hypothetical protein
MTSRQEDIKKRQDTAAAIEDDHRGDEEIVNTVSSNSPHLSRSEGEEEVDNVLEMQAVISEKEEEEEENEEKSVIAKQNEANDETVESSEQSTPSPVILGGVLEPSIPTREEINRTKDSNHKKCKKEERVDAFLESDKVSPKLLCKCPTVREKGSDSDDRELSLPTLVRQCEVQRIPVIGAVAVPGPRNISRNSSSSNNSDGVSPEDDAFSIPRTTAALSTSNAMVMATAISSLEFEMQVRERIIREAAEATVVVVDKDDANRRTTTTVDDQETRQRKQRQKCRLIVCGIIIAIVLLVGATAIGVVVGMREEEHYLEDETPP